MHKTGQSLWLNGYLGELFLYSDFDSSDGLWQHEQQSTWNIDSEY